MNPSRRQVLLGAAVVLPLALALGACTPEPPPPAQSLPQISFAHRPEIRLTVGDIETVRAFTPTGQAPHIEHAVPIAPVTVVESWIRDRLRAAGGIGFARATIVDASMTETALKTDQSITGIFKTQQARKIAARVEVRIDVETNGSGNGFVTAIVMRDQTLPENLTLQQRDEALIAFVEALGRDLDARLESEITGNLTGFLAP
ncbi:MAG: hypothetical protein VYB54_10010 [Pseudomonadota bacterium]|nr:hypothetical protein [Pseudomonadota bacterium]